MIALALLDSLGRVGSIVAIMLLALFVIGVQFVKSRELYGNGDSTRVDEQTNCPACGARTPVEKDSCRYCGESIATDDG